MTRNAWVTVRLPGARIAPATSTRTWFQTGAVKHGRNTASQETSTVGTWETAGMDSVQSGFIGVLESRRPGRARVPGLCRTGHPITRDAARSVPPVSFIVSTDGQ